MKGSSRSLPLKAFIRFLLTQHMPDDSGQLFGNHRSCYLPATSSFNLTVKVLNRFVMTIGIDRRLPESHTQIFIAIFIAGFMPAGSSAVIASRDQPAVAGKLLIAREAINISGFSQNTPAIHKPDARYRHE